MWTRQTRQSVTELLKVTEELHAHAEKRLPKHDWTIWYGAFMAQRMYEQSIAKAIYEADEAVLQALEARPLVHIAGGLTDSNGFEVDPVEEEYNEEERAGNGPDDHHGG